MVLRARVTSYGGLPRVHISSTEITPGPPIYFPVSDIANTGWTGVPNNTSLYDDIDEAVPSDSDYIVSGPVDINYPITFELSSAVPASTTLINIRARRTKEVGELRCVFLNASHFIVGTSDWIVLTNTFTTYPFNVTTTDTATRIRLEVRQ